MLRRWHRSERSCHIAFLLILQPLRARCLSFCPSKFSYVNPWLCAILLKLYADPAIDYTTYEPVSRVSLIDGSEMLLTALNMLSYMLRCPLEAIVRFENRASGKRMPALMLSKTLCDNESDMAQ